MPEGSSSAAPVMSPGPSCFSQRFVVRIIPNPSRDLDQAPRIVPDIVSPCLLDSARGEGPLRKEGPMRILIAEDDPTLACGLQHTLRQSGYAVDWVKDGCEADAGLLTDEFDLLILDISLPKLSGFEVLKRLRARNSRLPVLLLTALDSVTDRVRGLDAGA